MKWEEIKGYHYVKIYIIFFALFFKWDFVFAQIKKGDVQIFFESGKEYMQTIKSYHFMYEKRVNLTWIEFDTLKKENSEPVQFLYGSEIALNKIFSVGAIMGRGKTKSLYDSIIYVHSGKMVTHRQDIFRYLLFSLSVRLINRKNIILSLNSQFGNQYSSFNYSKGVRKFTLFPFSYNPFLYKGFSTDKYFRLSIQISYMYKKLGIYAGAFGSYIIKQGSLGKINNLYSIPPVDIEYVKYNSPSWGFRAGIFLRIAGHRVNKNGKGEK